MGRAELQDLRTMWVTSPHPPERFIAVICTEMLCISFWGLGEQVSMRHSTGLGDGSVVLAKDPAWVPHTLTRQLTAFCDSSLREFHILFWPSWALQACGAHTDNSHTNINTKIILKDSARIT